MEKAESLIVLVALVFAETAEVGGPVMLELRAGFADLAGVGRGTVRLDD